ncbi:MAG TPA: helix-hairpin-helix domain-containing protein [Gammaproteobacteria bacterium]|nr:helix-hairpin-helix domain-containing protein [Gammaproteobacteria bacterium]
MRAYLFALVLTVAVCLPGSVLAAGTVDLNSASPEELTGLNGIGDVLAERIVSYRESHDGFDSVEQLQDVEGIGAKTLETLREEVSVGD